MKRTLLPCAILFLGACTTLQNEDAKLPSPNTALEITTEPTIKGIRYVMSSVSSLDRTIEFYQSSVNFEVVKRYKVRTNQYAPALLSTASEEAEIALIRTPTVYLKLIDFNPKDDMPGKARTIVGPGYTHICFQSSFEDSAYDKFRSAGLEMITRGDGPADRGFGTAYAYGTDLDGTMIEMEVQEKMRRNDSSWIGHVANATPDLERMLSFYDLLLGYPAHRRAEIENSAWADSVGNVDGLVMKGGWSVVPNLGLEFWQFDNPRTPDRPHKATLDTIGYNYIAFEVTDLGHEIRRLEAHGVEFAGTPIDEEGWSIAFGFDPDGTLFSLQQNIAAPAVESIDDLAWIDRSKL